MLNRPSMQRLAGISRITFTIPTPDNLHFDGDTALCIEHRSHRLSEGFPTQDKSSKFRGSLGTVNYFFFNMVLKIYVTFRKQG